MFRRPKPVTRCRKPVFVNPCLEHQHFSFLPIASSVAPTREFPEQSFRTRFLLVGGQQELPEFSKGPKKASRAALLEQRSEWQQALSSFLYADDEQSQKQGFKALQNLGEPREREAAYDLILALDHQLALAGTPLATFRESSPSSSPLEAGESRYSCDFPGPWASSVPDGLRPVRFVRKLADGAKRWEVPDFVGADRPLLTICGDQGGPGLPSILFLAGELRLRLLPLWDPHHRAWRDFQLATQAASLWPIVLETTVVVNLVHGPWLNTSFFYKVQEALVEYAQTSNSQDRLRTPPSKYGVSSSSAHTQPPQEWLRWPSPSYFLVASPRQSGSAGLEIRHGLHSEGSS